MIDLTNPLEWNLITRQNLVANPPTRLRDLTFVTRDREIIIGISVPDEPTWRWGGYLTEQIPALPSSTAELFTALVAVASYRLSCRQYQGINLNPSLPLPRICTINFPPYFEAATVEVYERNDIDPIVPPIIVP